MKAKRTGIWTKGRKWNKAQWKKTKQNQVTTVKLVKCTTAWPSANTELPLVKHVFRYCSICLLLRWIIQQKGPGFHSWVCHTRVFFFSFFFSAYYYYYYMLLLLLGLWLALLYHKEADVTNPLLSECLVHVTPHFVKPAKLYESHMVVTSGCLWMWLQQCWNFSPNQSESCELSFLLFGFLHTGLGFLSCVFCLFITVFWQRLL